MSGTPPTLLSIVLQGVQRLLVHQGVLRLFECMEWSNNKYGRIAGLILGVALKLLMAFAIDGSMIYILVIDPFKGKHNLIVKVLLIIGLIAINIGDLLTNMGNVWSEYDLRRQLAEEANSREAEAVKRHKEIIAMLSAQSGITTPQINGMVNEFKSAMFEENKRMIIGGIYSSINNYDVMLRYNPVDQLTPRELEQRQLSQE